ncbi:DNA-processing protein DprA [Companilactobacillus sp. DQM5]|uniref:DNA-processing protein DprA n=1 Tax=Companilactobacillus sp. DQM5 TaxID=3463359 RepID=UPI004059A87E
MNKLFLKIAVTEVLSNKDLLKLLKMDKFNLDFVSKTYPAKFSKIINNSNYQNFDNLNVNIITFLDEEYPEKLREIYNPPAVLFYYGNINLIKNDCIGIVGARDGSNYSAVSIEKICQNIKKNKVIVSGMAKGVDSMAHKSAIKNHLATIAVMGTGINDCYPKSNEDLKQKIQNMGLVLSEYPPNHKTKPYNFVQRNRIIAGLSDNLVITEAKKKSGSLITASLALENNRNVYALPGSISSPLSEGTNELIRDGANVLLI